MTFLKTSSFLKTPTVLKTHPVVGLAIGVALVAIALLRLPVAAQADAAPTQIAADANCPIAEVSLDSGYGLSRKELRPACLE